MFNKLTKQLYPKARAWLLKIGSEFQLFHEALAESEQRFYDASLSLLDAILPDNDNFTAENATDWERALALYNQPYLTLDERKEIIKRKIQHPGNILPRQSRAYIEGELRKVGFDVYVHNNTRPPINAKQSIIDSFKIDDMVIDAAGIAGGSTTIANYIDEQKDIDFIVGSKDNEKFTFFIGGQVFGTRAQINHLRKNEFREMILKLKPAHTVGFLLLDYPTEAQFVDGSNFQFIDGQNMNFIS